MESKVIKVKAVQVSTSTGNSDFRYSGSIEPSLTVPLSFQTTGTVDQIYVDEGDVVKKGQLLASLEKDDMNNIYQVALSKYKQAKDAYDRLKSVHDEGSLTEIKWVEMETGYEQAKSSLDIAKSNLDKCDLRASINGVIARRNIEPGQSSISLNMANFELVDMKNVLVKVSVPENEISKMKPGIKAIITVSALDNKEFQGTVTKVNPVAETFSRTYEIKISVPNAGYELKPGMVCDVQLKTASSKSMITVPYQCITEDKDGNAFVYAIDSDRTRVHKLVVKTGNYMGDRVVILSGLETGQLVVAEGKEKLSDNSLIEL